MKNKQLRLLYQLAKLYQIETVYQDTQGRKKTATPQALWRTLQALGAPVKKPGDLADAIREHQQESWNRCCEPVAVAWEGEKNYIDLRLPQHRGDDLVHWDLKLESGAKITGDNNLALLPIQAAQNIEGQVYIHKRLPLPESLPLGYHQLTLHWPGQTSKIMVIATPQKAYTPRPGATRRTWGVFLPLYALRSRSSWAAGDLGDLGQLSRWVQQLGGSFTGTLPLLAAFLDKPLAPSPYSPASRLFWNEFYLNIECIPELQQCQPARELLNNTTLQKMAAAQRSAPLVNYRRGMAIKRSVLELLAHCHRTTSSSSRQSELQQWSMENPLAMDYARFRATMEYRGASWPNWPERQRKGLLRDGDFDPTVAYYHLYVQWLMHQQLQELGQGGGLYLDLPLGTHNEGYDTWREQALFVAEASCGSPPDPLNTQGQNWDLAPLHPELIRRQGYDYYLAVLRHHLQHTSMLRIDHVMGLHRLFWIPRGFTAQDGVYVKYRAQEFYALLTLESCRHQVQLVGEDLGTVPNTVRQAMQQHGINRMYILPFEISQTSDPKVNPVPREALSALNTHDMPPFATAWSKESKTRQSALTKLLHRKKLLGGPTNKTSAVLGASLDFLASSRAKFLLVNLEDLWLEKKPQNIPGTIHEYPNWRRKASLDWETFSQAPQVLNALSRINTWREHKE